MVYEFQLSRTSEQIALKITRLASDSVTFSRPYEKVQLQKSMFLLFHDKASMKNEILERMKALFPFVPPPPLPPTSHNYQLYGVTSGFTKFNMKTKCVCQILISPHVNFHNDRTMLIDAFLVRKLGALFQFPPPLNSILKSLFNVVIMQ